MKKLFILLFLLLPLLALAQPLEPYRHNFFTTNPAPVVDVVAGSNTVVTPSLIGTSTRRFTVSATGGGGTAQTNISYTAVTNAPWQWGTQYLTNWSQLNTNVFDPAGAATAATNGYVWTNLTVAMAGAVTNGWPWTNLTVAQASAVTNGQADVNLTGPFTVSGGTDPDTYMHGLVVTNSITASNYYGDGSHLTNLSGTSIQAGTINSNALDTATKSMLGTGSGSVPLNGTNDWTGPNTWESNATFNAGLTINGSGTNIFGYSEFTNNFKVTGTNTSIAGTRTFIHDSSQTRITNTATLTGTSFGDGIEKHWWNGNATVQVYKTNGIVQANAFRTATNSWALDAAIPWGTNSLTLVSGAATGGIPGITGFSSGDWLQIDIKATGDITFTNVASIQASDFLKSRTITNGNFAIISLQYKAEIGTNMAIVQFK